jgi:hypothetical protein
MHNCLSLYSNHLVTCYERERLEFVSTEVAGCAFTQVGGTVLNHMQIRTLNVMRHLYWS